MQADQHRQRPAPDFEPRLASRPDRSPPFNPRAYLYVGFFGGVVALVIVALANLGRIVESSKVRNATQGFAVLALLAAVGFVLFAPVEWWSEKRNVRLGLRVIAVVVALPLSRLHRGPAMGAAIVRTYESAWKALPHILLGAALQFGVLVAVGAARGTL